MDTRYERNGALFIWNEAKARSNARKHGVTFERATEAFFDPFLCIEDATRTDEHRFAVLGNDSDGRLLYVVHIELDGEVIRLISARRATAEERDRYDS